MNKGDKFVVEIAFVEALSGRTGWFNFVSDDGGCGAAMVEVERAAAAYAAKQTQPAPVAPPDWQPQAGDRVLVEGVLKSSWCTEGTVRIDFAGNGNATSDWVDNSAIVGPAPVRARFAVGDEVVVRATLERGNIHRARGIEELWTVNIGGAYNDYFEADLLTLAEARERLAK